MAASFPLPCAASLPSSGGGPLLPILLRARARGGDPPLLPRRRARTVERGAGGGAGLLRAAAAHKRASSPASFESAASLLPGELQIGGGIGGGPALAPPLLRLARKEGSRGGALASGGEAGVGRRAAWPRRE